MLRPIILIFSMILAQSAIASAPIGRDEAVSTIIFTVDSSEDGIRCAAEFCRISQLEGSGQCQALSPTTISAHLNMEGLHQLSRLNCASSVWQEERLLHNVAIDAPPVGAPAPPRPRVDAPPVGGKVTNAMGARPGCPRRTWWGWDYSACVIND